MKSIFEKEYKMEQAIKARYEAAEQAHDETGMEAARASYQAHREDIAAQGRGFEKIYCLYSKAREADNEYINIRSIVWNNEVGGYDDTNYMGVLLDFMEL